MSVRDDAQIDILIPTAINTVLMVNENIIRNMRQRMDPSLTLPSLYKRAFLVVNETDEVAVVRQEST
jgi:hypothetical protein